MIQSLRRLPSKCFESPRAAREAIIAHGNFASLNDDDKRTYENRVVSFFLLRLPARGSRSLIQDPHR